MHCTHNDTKKPGLSLNFCLNSGLALIFLITALFLLYTEKVFMRQQAMVEAEAKAKILLDHNLAIHTYFSKMLKPKLFELTDPYRDTAYFDSSWMSSTFAVREIDKYFQALGNKNYYYKECAINARSPENEADELEKSFLLELNANPQLTVRSFVRKLDGAYYYVTLRRGESMENSCLRCHSTPEQAPAGLVSIYGPERSFHRRLNEVVSAISIRIPLAAAFTDTELFSKRLSVILIISLFCLFLGHFLLYRLIVGKPLNIIHAKALLISQDDHHLGEEIPLPYAKELHVLTRAFNSMSTKLRHYIDNLSQQVDERTAELTTSNKQLQAEICQRKKTQEEREALIIELHQALSEIKTLRGIVPICSFCKQIRDDKGYWNQVESYVQKHTEAEFSHGICPKCLAEHYPDLMGEEDEGA